MGGRVLSSLLNPLLESSLLNPLLESSLFDPLLESSLLDPILESFHLTLSGVFFAQPSIGV